MAKFILMLTLNDETIPDAARAYEAVRDTAVEFIGFKDIGLPLAELEALNKRMQADGRKTFLEMVSLDEDSQRRTAASALQLGTDYVVGGTLIDVLVQALAGSGIKLYPYVGEVVGHPAQLTGEVDDIIAQAMAAQHAGVDGINLLSYRYTGDPLALTAQVIEAVEVPVICAGSVRDVEQVRALDRAGAWAFTVGGAVLERKFVPGGSLAAQVEAVLAAAGDPGLRG